MARVIIDDEQLIDVLVERVQFWTDDEDVVKLYNEMYSRAVNDGCFEDVKLDIYDIVDNDCVNYCTVLSDGDEDYNKVKELAKAGETDISCEHLGYNFIEACNDDLSLILVRY